MQVTLTSAAGRPGIPADVARVDYVSPVDEAADWGMLWRCPEPSDLWWVFLHGHGSTGDQLWTRPDLRAEWWPLAAAHRLNVLALNLRGNAWMSPAAAADVQALIAWLRRERGAARIVLGSGSMGGTGSLLYASLHPDDVDGVIALCPASDLARYHAWCRSRTTPGVLAQIADAIEAGYGGTPGQRPAVYARHAASRHPERLTMPLFVGHGTDDATIPVSESRALVEALGERPTLHYVEQAGGNHESPLRLMPQAMAWVLAQL